jgi:hypothetical protein
MLTEYRFRILGRQCAQSVEGLLCGRNGVQLLGGRLQIPSASGMTQAVSWLESMGLGAMERPLFSTSFAAG